jgi:hypothetical protein
MRLSTLQIGLIVAGVLLVAGVIVYNAWQERRIRRRITSAFRKPDTAAPQPDGGLRVEPTMRTMPGDREAPADVAQFHRRARGRGLGLVAANGGRPARAGSRRHARHARRDNL